MRHRSSLVVILLILAVFAGICIPLVMRARDESQLARCKDNLKSIGIATHNYYDATNFLPLAAMKSDVIPPERRLSWMFELDPFVHARMDPDWVPMRGKPWDDEENLKVARKSRMPWYLCPANPLQEINDLALSHYVGVAGLGSNALHLPLDDSQAGIFGYERAIKFEDIKDGLANTLMAIETMRDNGPWIAGGHPTSRGLVGNSQPYLGRGNQFGGAHKGITVTLFADGSARAIRDSIDARTLQAMATIAAPDAVGPYQAE